MGTPHPALHPAVVFPPTKHPVSFIAALALGAGWVGGCLCPPGMPVPCPSVPGTEQGVSRAVACQESLLALLAKPAAAL